MYFKVWIKFKNKLAFHMGKKKELVISWLLVSVICVPLEFPNLPTIIPSGSFPRTHLHFLAVSLGMRLPEGCVKRKQSLVYNRLHHYHLWNKNWARSPQPSSFWNLLCFLLDCEFFEEGHLVQFRLFLSLTCWSWIRVWNGGDTHWKLPEWT